MRMMLLITVCVLLSGCSYFRKAEVQQAPPIVEVATNDCYTVDLFTKVKIEQPDASVPPANQQFLGEWGGGAWNDVWCHGLLVNKVNADGTVELVEMHAPYVPWGQPATAFRRIGRIDDQGNLRFAYGTTRLSYRIENGKLVGNNNGLYGNLTVELVHIGTPPATVQLSEAPTANPVRVSQLPTPNPLRISQLALAVKAGS